MNKIFFNFNRKLVSLILIAVIIFSPLSTIINTASAAVSDPTITLSGPASVNIGDTFNVPAITSNFVNSPSNNTSVTNGLNGIQWRISFDNTKVRLQDYDDDSDPVTPNIVDSLSAFNSDSNNPVDSTTLRNSVGTGNSGKANIAGTSAFKFLSCDESTCSEVTSSSTINTITITYNDPNGASFRIANGTALKLFFKAVSSGNANIQFKDGVVLAGANFINATTDSNGTIPSLAGTSASNNYINVTTQVASANIPVTGVSVNPTSLALTTGATSTIIATITPNTATNQSITWTTSSSTIASVNNGVITAVSAGTATITATTVDGSFTATTFVTVSNPAQANIPVTGVSVNPTSLALTTGATSTITATITPNTATNQSITWTTSSSTIASVNNGTATITATTVDGSFTATTFVTVSNPAQANIPVTGVSVNPTSFSNNNSKQHSAGTATTVDGSFTATTFVTVSNPAQANIPVTGVSVNPTSLALTTGATSTITATITPNTATNQSITWTTSSSTIASVNNGVITAVSAGTATITATTVDGSFTATTFVTVSNPAQANIPVTGVSVNPTSLALTTGATSTITATITPNTATNQSITWTTSSSTIATVNNGVITAVSAGTATITATTVDGSFTATTFVTVSNPAQANIPVTGVSVNPTSLTLTTGATSTIIATITPNTATNQSITWTTSSSTIATVNNGVITAVSAGTATITATTLDGSFTATTFVTVSNDTFKSASTTLPTTQTLTNSSLGFNASGITQVGNVNVSFTFSSSTIYYSTTTTSDNNGNFTINISSSTLNVLSNGAYTATWALSKSGFDNNSFNRTITLNYPIAPAFTNNLTAGDVSYSVGNSATALTVSASGNPTPTYQWQSSANGTTWSNISNTTNTLTPSTSGLSTTSYRVIITNSAGIATSSVVRVIVNLNTANISGFSYSKTSYIYGDSEPALILGLASSTGTKTYSTASTACNVNSSTGAITTISNGNCVIRLDIAADASFSASSFTFPAMTISQKALTTTITATDKIYDANTTIALSAGALQGVVSGDIVSISNPSANGSVLSANAGSAKSVTLPTYTLTGTNSSKYTLTTPTSPTVNITAKSGLTVTGDNKSVVFGSTAPTYTYTISGQISGETGTQLFSANPTCTSTYTNSSIVGTYPITCSGGTVNTNYSTPSFVAGTVTVGQAASTLSINASQSKIYGDTPFTPVVTKTGSTGAVTFNSSTPAVCTATNSSSVTIVGVGTCSLTATLASDTNFTGITSVSQNVAINAKALTTTITATDKIYDANTTIALSAGALQGVVSGDIVSISNPSANGSVLSANAGSAKSVTLPTYTLTGTNASKYTLTTPTSPTVNITAKSGLTVTGDNKSVVFGSTAPTYTYTISGQISGETGTQLFSANPTCTSTYTNSSIVGTYPITCSGGTVNTNYSTPSFVAGTVTVGQAASTLSINASQSKIYGDAPFTPVVTKTGSTGGVTFNSSTPAVCTATNSSSVTIVGVGTCSLTATLASDTNFTGITSVSQNVAINAKALTTTITATDKIYDANTTIALSAGALQGVVSGDIVSISNPSANGSVLSANAGSAKSVTLPTYTLTGTNSSKYTLTTPTSPTVNITAKSGLTVTGDNKSVVFGSTAPTYTYTISGQISGETGTQLFSANPTCTSTYTNSSIVGTYPITCSGGTVNTNYSTPSFVAGTVTVGQAASTLSINASQSKIYGDAPFTPVVTKTGSTGGVTFNSSTPAVCTATNSSSVTIVGVGTCSLTATLASDTNFTGITSVSQNVTINAKALSVSGSSAATRAYNGSTTIALTGGTLSGVVGSDVVTLSTPAGTLSSKDVGTRSITANYTITGTDASKYTLTQPTIASVSITTAPITISGTSVSNKVYDGNTTAIISTIGTISGLIGSETLGITGVATFSTSTGGTAIPVSVAYTTANGTNGGLASNYSSLANGSVQADITKAQSSVSINSVSSTNYSYNGIFSATTTKTANSTGFATITSSTDNICSVSYNASTSNYSVNILSAGTCILNANLTSDSNYSSATSTKSITINPSLPGSISTLSATAGNSLINLSWSLEDKGGVNITNHLIEKCDGTCTATSTWDTIDATTTKSATNYTINNLINGQTYSFRVKSVNSVGTSTNYSNIISSSPIAPVISGGGIIGGGNFNYNYNLNNNLTTPTPNSTNNSNTNNTTNTIIVDNTKILPVRIVNIKSNIVDNSVKDLQSFLNNNGYNVAKKGLGSKGNETTKFGPATLSALKKFQQTNLKAIGIKKVTGNLDSKTLNFINKVIKGEVKLKK